MRRRALLDAGDERLGWKIGFGSPAALRRLGTREPLVGFLVRSALVQPGATVSIARWTKAVAEPELAVHLGRDVAAGARSDEAAAAVAGVGPAIELADVDRPSDDPEEILAGNVYQRAVVLGGTRSWPGAVRGLEARVFRDGVEVASTGDPEAQTGETLALVAGVARLLSPFREGVRAGDVVITGSIVPPLEIAGDETIALALAGLPAISVHVSALAPEGHVV